MLILKDLVNLETALPVIPEVVALLISELNHDEPNFYTIEKLINTDPVITARLLRLSNTAYFNFSREISTVYEALNFMGYKRVLDLIIAASVASSFSKTKHIDMNQFWQYSLNVAKLTSVLASKINIDKQTGFTIGLVHAIGELVMHSGLPTEIVILNEKINQFLPDRAYFEKEMFGYSYADIGGIFAEKWKLSNLIINSLSQQCLPVKDVVYNNNIYEPMAILLYIAVWRCRAKEANYDSDELIKKFPLTIASLLNISLIEVLEKDPIVWTSQSEVALLI